MSARFITRIRTSISFFARKATSKPLGLECLTNCNPMLAAPRRDLSNIRAGLPPEPPPEVEQPGDEPFSRMEQQQVQHLFGFASRSHRVFSVRQLKNRVHLEARSAAQQVLGRHAPGGYIAGSAE